MPGLALPAALFGLALLPALVAIYLLRDRRRPFVVSALFLFAGAREAPAGGRRRDRLVTPLLLALEILAILLLVLAAARPYAVSGRGTPLALVLDDSLSMTAGQGVERQDDSPRTRALTALTKELAGQEHAPVVVVLARETPVLLGRYATFESARGALGGWSPRAPRADLAAARLLARESAGPRARILVVSDHLPPGLAKDEPDTHLAFGRPLPNTAFSSAVRREVAETGAEEAILEVRSFSTSELSLMVRVTTGKETRESPLRLAPGETRRLVQPLPAGAGTVTASLPKDALPADDGVVLAPARSRRVSVSLALSPGPMRDAFERALEATRRAVVVDAAATGRDVLLRIEEAAVLPDRPGSAPTVTPALVTLRVASQEAGASAYAGPFLLDHGHPLTASLSIPGVVWAAPRLAAPRDRALVSAGDVPLLLEEAGPVRTILTLALAPRLSTLTLAPAWPAFVADLLDEAASRAPGPLAPNVLLGTDVSVRLPEGIAEATITTPSGTSFGAASSAGDGLVVFRASEPGLFTAAAGERSWTVGVNALEEKESNLALAATGRHEGAFQAGAERGLRELLPFLALLALAGLVLHRLVQLRYEGREPVRA